MEGDELQILKLFEDGDRALIAADLTALSCIFTDDYIQYDESGKSVTKRDVIDNLKNGAIRYISMISTGRRIRLLSDEVAIVHGSENDEVEQGGRRFSVRYIYMDVVMKRNGKWRIVQSQLARPELSFPEDSRFEPDKLTGFQRESVPASISGGAAVQPRRKH